jgi:hypothetical protein
MRYLAGMRAAQASPIWVGITFLCSAMPCVIRTAERLSCMKGAMAFCTRWAAIAPLSLV